MGRWRSVAPGSTQSRTFVVRDALAFVHLKTEGVLEPTRTQKPPTKHRKIASLPSMAKRTGAAHTGHAALF